MTNEKAREIIYDQWQEFLEHNLDYAGISEAYKMAIHALEQTQPQDGDRAVSLNAVENIINKYIDGSFEWGAMLVQIKRLPSVTSNEEEMAIKYINGYAVQR